ncbi:DUF1330 domain-containing protein [Amycolatopsis sp. K13G38]|uniref:DUF1330 domain-containing protein n=1 Tax=Amycolatopsis acididurans TaxID=2724524 RepID=A0ABX1JCI2_9PSEU|nr:DUF1330 domain-containing protein [Amycolatopsis acididurans]NKQ56951.1 DUF1330 domain-containing protein [Amycolatopsis acididurans]
MSAPHFLLALMNKHDAETFAQYQAGAVQTLSAYEMAPVAVTSAIEVEEGELEANMLVLIRFSDEDEFRRWWTSSEYAKVQPLREKSAETVFAITFPGALELPSGAAPA